MAKAAQTMDMEKLIEQIRAEERAKLMAEQAAEKGKGAHPLYISLDSGRVVFRGWWGGGMPPSMSGAQAVCVYDPENAIAAMTALLTHPDAKLGSEKYTPEQMAALRTNVEALKSVYCKAFPAAAEAVAKRPPLPTYTPAPRREKAAPAAE